MLALVLSSFLAAGLVSADASSPFTCQDGALPWSAAPLVLSYLKLCLKQKTWLIAGVFICRHRIAPTTRSDGQQSYSCRVRHAHRWLQRSLMPGLLGSGARGTLGDAPKLATYDGPGKLISLYSCGNLSDSAVLAAESFITIIPIAPTSTRHYQPDAIASVVSSATAQFPIDQDRIIAAGYSMGSRGVWRELIYNHDLYAAGVADAGAAEKPGGQYVTADPSAGPDFGLLGTMLDVPVWMFAGGQDPTALEADIQSTQDEIVRLGGTKSQLTILPNANHRESHCESSLAV